MPMFLVSFKDEKEAHAVTTEKLLLQEHESKQLRIERHSLKVGLDASGMTNNRLETEMVTLKQQLKDKDNFENTEVFTVSNSII